jgi:hypothetical protein
VQQLGRVIDPAVDLVGSDLGHPEAERDVLEHRHVREHGVALEHHRDPPVAWRQTGHVTVADPDPPGIDLLETGDRAEERRLATPRRPEQDHELTVGDREVDIVDGADLVEHLGDVLEPDVSHGPRTPSLHDPAP